MTSDDSIISSFNKLTVISVDNIQNNEAEIVVEFNGLQQTYIISLNFEEISNINDIKSINKELVEIIKHIYKIKLAYHPISKFTTFNYNYSFT